MSGAWLVFGQMTDPAAVVLRQGQQHQFAAKCPTGHKCQFELLPGHDSTSSVTPDGLYTAPVRVERHGFVGGCPILPQNSIYNTRVDAMPVHPRSAEYVAALRDTSTWYDHNIHFSRPGNVVNLVAENTPKYHIKNYYGSGWDGDYPFSSPPTADFGSRDDPKARVQSGWALSGPDNHYLAVNRDTCQVTEYYNPSAPGVGYSVCKDCSSVASAIYPAMTFANADGIAGKGVSTAIAMGGWLIPMQLSQLELAMAVKQQGSAAMVKHALAVTVSNGALFKPAFAWPATQPAWSGWGIVPYGTRLRLKASFVDSYNVAADSSDPRIQAYIMAVLRTIQYYGMFVMDGTIPVDAWAMHMRSERIHDPEIDTALGKIGGSPQLVNNQLINALEVVDESSYQTSATSDVVRDPLANPETVVLRDTTTGAVIDVRDIAIHPPTIGSMQAQYNVVAGAPPIDLTKDVFATGLADNSAIVWTVSQGGGSISPTGLYTPPADISAATTFTIRAAAAEDASVFVEMRAVVFPPIGTGLYVRNSSVTGKAANLREGGRTWWNADASGNTINVGGIKGYGNPWGSGAKALEPGPYPSAVYSNSGAYGEHVFSLYLPNGRYRVTALIYTGALASAQNAKIRIELNGGVAQAPVRFEDMVGGRFGVGFPMTYGVSVANGELVVGWKAVGAGGYETLVGFVVQPDSTEAHVEIPFVPAEILLNGSFQFSSTGFGMDGAATWSVSPNIGNMDAATGLYTAPKNEFAPPQTIAITATPVADPSKPASVTTQLSFGTLAASVTPVINRTASAKVISQLNGAPFDKVAWSAAPIGSMTGNTYRAPDALDSDTKVTITGTVIGDPARTVTANILVRAQPAAVRIAFGSAGSAGTGCGFTDPAGNAWTCYGVYGAYKGIGAPGFTLGPNTSFVEWKAGTQADFGMGPMNRLYQNGIRTPQKGSSFEYIVPGFPAGRYTVVLHFGSEVQKPTTLNVDVNGVRVATNAKPAKGLVAERLTFDLRLPAPGDVAIRIADAGGYSQATDTRTLLNGMEVLPVIGPVPSISYLTADPQFIQLGDIARLRWATTGATTVQIDNGIGAVEAAGSKDVSPEETTDYVLTAANESGQANGAVRVYVYRRTTSGSSGRQRR